MDHCTLTRLRDGEPIELLEAFVLARAYEAAWQALYHCDPVGRHIIQSLGLVIDFGPTGERRN